MNKKGNLDLTTLLLALCFIVFLIWVLFGMYLSSVSDYNCKTYCDNEGAIIYKMVESGSWILNDDYCICFFEHETRKVHLSEVVK